MMYYETEFPVRYYETDQMAVVHHSNYIRYFELARNQMMADGGFPMWVCENEYHVMIPIVSVTCRFKHPARLGDTLRAVAMIDSVPQAKLTIRQEVWNQKGELCAEGEVLLGFINSATFRPVRAPEPLVKLIESRLNDR